MPAYKYTLKNGKTMWYSNFYYTDWTGEKKHICKRGFKTQREAKEYERTFIDHQSAASDILFTNLVENYLEDMGHRLKPTTMENKRHIIESKLLPYFSRLKTCDIDTIRIRKWQNELISFRDSCRKPYSQTYLKTVNNQMSAIMNYAVKHYGLTSNPCRAAGSIGKSPAEEMNFWTQEQYELFSKSIQKSAIRLAFDILFYSGIREGELLALTPSDILPDKRISINKNYAKIRGQELFLIPKTSKSKRVVAIPDFLYDDIQEYLSKLYGIQPNDRIFYFTKHALEKEIKRIAQKVSLPEIRVHDIRHSHASMLIDMGFDILEISKRLGHESVKTTLDTYSHLYPEKDTKLAGALDKLRRPHTAKWYRRNPLNLLTGYDILNIKRGTCW